MEAGVDVSEARPGRKAGDQSDDGNANGTCGVPTLLVETHSAAGMKGARLSLIAGCVATSGRNLHDGQSNWPRLKRIKAKRTLKWQRDPQGMRFADSRGRQAGIFSAWPGWCPCRPDRGQGRRQQAHAVLSRRQKRTISTSRCSKAPMNKSGSRKRGLDLEHLDPPEAIERLISFTWNYFIRNPEFLALLNTEKSGESTPPQALDQGQVDALALCRDDPHRGHPWRRKRRLPGLGRSGATLYLDRGLELFSISPTAPR